MRPKVSSTPPSPAGATSGGVLFVELTGPRSRARLERLAADLPPELATELLVGHDRDDLHLLVCRGAEGALDRVEPPEGANAWRFGPAGERTDREAEG